VPEAIEISPDQRRILLKTSVESEESGEPDHLI
jgi:hypothetical protein